MSSKKQATEIPVPPKRPMSAYFLFLNDIREELKKENPKANVADISKLAGHRWSNVDEKTKAKFEKQQAEVKKEYEKVKADYEALHGPIKTVRKSKKDKGEKVEKKGKRAAKK